MNLCFILYFTIRWPKLITDRFHKNFEETREQRKTSSRARLKKGKNNCIYMDE